MRGTLILPSPWKIRFVRMRATRYTRVTSPRVGARFLTLPRQYRNCWTKDPRFRDSILQSCTNWVGHWWKELSVESLQWKNSVDELPSGRARTHRTLKKLRIHGEYSRRWGRILQMNFLIKSLWIRDSTINARTFYRNGAYSGIWYRVEHIWQLTWKSQGSCSDSTFTDCCRLIMS
jgi:hypothetical protein